MVQIGVYLVLSFVQTVLLLDILKRSWRYFTTEQWQIIIWSLFATLILSANAYYFPLSIFSKLLSPPISPLVVMIVFYLSLFLSSLLLVNSVIKHIRTAVSVLLIIISIGLIDYYTNLPENYKGGKSPNIIILGIDSLSPESVTSKNMPFVYQLIQGSTQFTETISPLARTYPAWSSILTGLYTQHHHAEENLVPKTTVNSQASIIWALNRADYTTVYATDDRRFNSIDTDFGFKYVIGPKIGANDVILGSYNDFPLGNLLINSRPASWLFPYNYSNRASYFSYYPNTFDAKLRRELSQLPSNKPLFLAVHFALPHWPYAWASSLPDKVNNEFSLTKRDYLYQLALRRVDKQFQSFYSYLKSHGYFNNTMLIVLSDHGEVLYYPNTRLTNYHNYQSSLTSRLAEYFKNKTATDLDKSAGHGSDILSPGQYHCVMAFNIYRNSILVTAREKIKTRIALFDLAPTILNYLNIPIPHAMDGISILDAINNAKHKLPERTFFIESGMYPNQEFSKKKAIELGHKIYNINATTGELELKGPEVININNAKLYGVIRGDWILALYPDDTDYIPVIQNLVTGQWTDDLQNHFAQTTPALELKKQLQQFYGQRLVLPIY